MSTTQAGFESLQSDLLELQKDNLLLKLKTSELESEALGSKSKATVLQSKFLEFQKHNLLLNSKTTELQSEIKPLSLD